MKIQELVDYTGDLLQVERFKDYCPNGLQVAGRAEVQKIVTGVTASMSLLEAAVEAQADVVLVHHGYFWKSEDACITGMKRARIKFLLENNLNLMAYHLPLDAHPKLGNNAQLGCLMQVKAEIYTGEQNLVALGTLQNAQSLSQFSQGLAEKLGRAPLVLGDVNKPIKRVAWCTGSAQQYITQALDMGADVFVSGEVSEQTFHVVQETGIAYISAGHHATERYGVQALGQHLAAQFGLAHTFIDIENPI